MNPSSETPDPSGTNPASDVESLLATIASQEAEHAAAQPGGGKTASTPGNAAVQAFDFRNPTLLSPGQERKLRAHQEEFVRSLAARLSLHLRLELSLKLTGLQTITYRKLAQSWANPSHLTLFKIEPLRGIAILEIPPRLGLAMVDRLMGGRGEAAEGAQEISEIEQALLEQTVQLLLEEWCRHWVATKDLKPVILGCENDGRFVQTASPETMMLVLGMEAIFGECHGQIQIGIPYISLEPLIGPLNHGVETVPASAPAPKTPAPATAFKWNASFDEVCVPVSAEWEGLEMTARAVLELKVGDVVRIAPQCAQQISVRIGELLKFQGRPGTIAGQWAVELTQAIKP